MPGPEIRLTGLSDARRQSFVTVYDALGTPRDELRPLEAETGRGRVIPPLPPDCDYPETREAADAPAEPLARREDSAGERVVAARRRAERGSSGGGWAQTRMAISSPSAAVQTTTSATKSMCDSSEFIQLKRGERRSRGGSPATPSGPDMICAAVGNDGAGRLIRAAPQRARLPSSIAQGRVGRGTLKRIRAVGPREPEKDRG